MADLPNQDALVVPIEWSGSTQKHTMEAAGYQLSGTIGWRPWREEATLSWGGLSASEAQTMLDGFRATNWNGVYAYRCNVRGDIRVRLTGSYSFSEELTGLTVMVTAGVKRV